MGKGNLLLGMGRGKVGDLVLTRGAGEQIVRARNRNPKNPQTTKQMAQRAALATVVEFFTRGKRNLFKFAFESKRKGESDYNAFVRANINRVPVQSRKTIVENGPVFGEFVMSQGSLSQPSFDFSGGHSTGALFTAPLPSAGDTLTIGELSSAIIALNGYLDGDIITIVAIHNTGDFIAEEFDSAIDYGELIAAHVPSAWVIRQFTLDSNSTALVSSLGIFNKSAITQGAKYVELDNNVFGVDGEEGGSADMLAVIVSRNTPSGLKVSTSTAKVTAGAVDVMSVGMADDWKIWVAKHWNDATSLDVAPDNILEGSISEN